VLKTCQALTGCYIAQWFVLIYVEVIINGSETCLIFQTVKSQLYNILMFPEGGWLVDCANSEAEDGDVDMDSEVSRHQKQLDDLRQLCIPKVC
jgi:hypothetical protein